MKKILFTDRELDLAFITMAKSLVSEYEVFITCRSIDEDKKHDDSGINWLTLDKIKSKFDFKVIYQIRKYNKHYKFDIIFSPSSSGLSNSIIATIGSKTLNIGYRGTGAKIRKTDPSYYLGVLNPRLSHLVCETNYVKEYVSNFINPQKLSVLTKPFDLKWVDEAYNNPIIVEEFRKKSLKIVTVANTKGRPYKGLRTLIKAFQMINDDDICLTIVGDFEEEDFKIANNHISGKRIKFVGEKPNGSSYIAGADLYILPSHRDASPRVVREAMALAKPTIVSDIDGARELICNNISGLLYDDKSPEDLSKAILWMKYHQEKRKEMGKEGVNMIKRIFNPDKYNENFKRLFDKLIQEKSKNIHK